MTPSFNPQTQWTSISNSESGNVQGGASQSTSFGAAGIKTLSQIGQLPVSGGSMGIPNPTQEARQGVAIQTQVAVQTSHLGVSGPTVTAPSASRRTFE